MDRFHEKFVLPSSKSVPLLVHSSPVSLSIVALIVVSVASKNSPVGPIVMVKISDQTWQREEQNHIHMYLCMHTCVASLVKCCVNRCLNYRGGVAIGVESYHAPLPKGGSRTKTSSDVVDPSPN